MTLGSETAAVLMRAMAMLYHQTLPTQHAVLSADERKSALLQLMLTTETAAKLADIAHVEAVAVAQDKAASAEAWRIRAEIERLKAEAVKIGREVEWVMVEAERTRGEAEMVGIVAEEVMREVEETRAEGEQVSDEAERRAAYTKRAKRAAETVMKESTAQETEMMKAAVEMVRKGVEITTQEAETMKAEVEKAGKEVERTVQDVERTKAEVEKASKEVEAMLRETERARAGAERVGSEIEKSAAESEWIEAEVERVGREVERTVQETERIIAEVEKERRENEQQTTPAPTGAPGLERLEASGVDLSHTPLIQSSPGPSSPGSVPPVVPLIRITGLYSSHRKVREIADGLEYWNSNNVEQYTLASWAWFMHSETEAFFFLDRPGEKQTCMMRKTQDRTGTIKIPSTMFHDLDISKGYYGVIYGRTMENGSRDSVMLA
ncbi:hypothetical protein DFP73DRAFT_567208 [Morchella snyderi]|nr:hypothetical protein DFP73DRAFT_567208 [Morchella snyderi]